MKKNRKMKEIVFFDNYDTDFFCTREDAIELIMDNCDDYERKEDIPDSEILDTIYLEEEFWWDEFMREFNRMMEGNTYLLCGTVGRWNGRCDGGCFVESINDICRTFGADCGYFKFYEENGHFYVKCSHHDGTNYAELKKVSGRGIDYYGNHEWDKDEAELHDTMWNSNFMTSLPHFGKRLGYRRAI